MLIAPARKKLIPFYKDDFVEIYHGDCFEIMPLLKINFDLLLTDPPYDVEVSSGAGAFGKRNHLTSTAGFTDGGGRFQFHKEFQELVLLLFIEAITRISGIIIKLPSTPFVNLVQAKPSSYMQWKIFTRCGIYRAWFRQRKVVW